METISQSASRPKVGLALSGGSALGNVHIGVLQAFEDHGIPVDCIAGTSAGAVVAACYAFGIPTEEMAEKTQGLSWRRLSNFSYSRMGLITTKGIADLVEGIIGKVKIEDARIPLAIMAADIETGEPVAFKKGDLSQAIAASVCIPGLFVPVDADGRHLVDGGLVENLPLSLLDGMGAEVKIGVNLARWRKYRKPANVVDVMLNTLDIMTHRQTNQHAKGAQVLIEPHLEHFTSSDFKKAAELISEGYRTATKAMPEIEKALCGQEPVSAEAAAPSLFKRMLRWLKG